MNAHSLRVSNYITILAIGCVLMSCGRVLPSRAFVINLHRGGVTQGEIAQTLSRVLVARSFKDIGKSGYDLTQDELTSINFVGPQEMIVIIGMNRKDHVSVRVSQNREAFSAEAEELFEFVVGEATQRWPSAIEVEPQDASK